MRGEPGLQAKGLARTAGGAQVHVFFLSFIFKAVMKQVNMKSSMERYCALFLDSLNFYLPCTVGTSLLPFLLALKNERGKPREMSHQGAPGRRGT